MSATCLQPSSKFSLAGIYLINARSLAKPYALDQLLADLTGYHLDIAIVTEMHLKKHHLPGLYRADGFRIFRRDRLARIHGGGAIIVRSDFDAEEYLIDNVDRSIELLWIRIVIANKTMYIGALYHPPKPIYKKSILLDQLERAVDMITSTEPHALLILGGDLNALTETEVVHRTGLIPLVTQPTRGNNILDRLFVSEPGYTNIKILDSAIKADHKAIVASSRTHITSWKKGATSVDFRKRTPQQNAALLECLSKTPLQSIEDPQTAWDQFYSIVVNALNIIYPPRSVTITSADPNYVTPEIKSLLRRNKPVNEKWKNGGGICMCT